MDIEIRPEKEDDIDAIGRVVLAAFRKTSHLDHKEGLIIRQLRSTSELRLSLVATIGDEVIGHVAASGVVIQGTDQRRTLGWLGLGPLSVRPDYQRKGIGTKLVQAALDRMKQSRVPGCVVLGRPGFYGRFGFESVHNMRFANAPARFLMRILLTGDDAEGVLEYHEAFDVGRRES